MSTKKILMVFMGGDRNLDVALEQSKKIAQKFQTKALLTKSAEKIIGEQKIRRSTGINDVILDDGRQNPIEISGWADLLVVPVLTLNGLSKIANLEPDSLHSNVIIGCLEKGIPVVVSKDSIWCSCYPEPQKGSPLYTKVEDFLAQIKSFGIKITSAKDLSKEVFDIIESDIQKKYEVTYGSSGKAFEKSTLKTTYGSAGKAFEPSTIKTTYGTAGKEFSTNIAKFGPIISDICPAFKEGVECSSCGLCVEKKPSSTKAIIDSGADRISATSGVSDEVRKIASMIDHTLLKANATQEEIGKLCEEAKKYGFASVCVNPAYVGLCSQLLKGTGVKVCTVVGFPLGATTPTVKAIEARDAIANGADEIDMVINIGALKSGNYQLVLDDIKAVREATKGKILKVILETAYLTKEEKIKGCLLAKEAGADFVKTSTGFGPSGATVEDILLMREAVGKTMGIKASGGIRSFEDAKKMVEAGATRIGASASVAIVTGKKSESKY